MFLHSTYLKHTKEKIAVSLWIKLDLLVARTKETNDHKSKLLANFRQVLKDTSRDRQTHFKSINQSIN